MSLLFVILISTSLSVLTNMVERRLGIVRKVRQAVERAVLEGDWYAPH